MNSRPAPLLNPSIRFALFTSVGVVIAVLGYYRVLWPTFRDFLQAIDFADIPFADFSVYYYEMGKEIFATKSPVLGFHYSPFFAIVLGLFGMLPVSTATAIWVFFLVTAILALIYISFRLIPFPEPRFLPLIVALVITSFPVLHDFKWGQVGTILTVLVLGGLYAARKKGDILAGVLLASAASLKYYPAIFILPFLIGQRKKLVFSFLGGSVLFLVVIPLLVLGGHETLTFWERLTSDAYAKQLAASGPNSQNFVNTIMRWSAFLGYDSQTLRFIVRTAGYLFLEGVLVLIVLICRRSLPHAYEWAFVLLFLSIPFFIATSWPHYLVYFPFCQLFLFRQIRHQVGLPLGRRRLLLALLLLSAVLSSVFALNVAGHWRAYTGAGFLFLSNAIMCGIAWRIVLFALTNEGHERNGNESPVDLARQV